MMKKIFLLLITLFILVGCTAQQPIQAENTLADQEVVMEQPVPTEATPTEEMIVETSEGETPKSAIKEFTVEAYRFEFEPSTIEVNEGDTVRITIKSRDVEHGISIPEFKVNKEFGKDPVIVEFVADKKGTYTMFCSEYCGKGHKEMKGTLIVK